RPSASAILEISSKFLVAQAILVRSFKSLPSVHILPSSPKALEWITRFLQSKKWAASTDR
ncbi:Ribokinase, partial [Dysosmobacter welbionis]